MDNLSVLQGRFNTASILVRAVSLKASLFVFHLVMKWKMYVFGEVRTTSSITLLKTERAEAQLQQTHCLGRTPIFGNGMGSMY